MHALFDNIAIPKTQFNDEDFQSSPSPIFITKLSKTSSVNDHHNRSKHNERGHVYDTDDPVARSFNNEAPHIKFSIKKDPNKRGDHPT